MHAEETFLIGQRIGVRIQHPFWDADLVDLLVKIRPHVQIRGGLSKALERSSLIRRFPGLGFESQRRGYVSSSHLSMVLSMVKAQARKVHQAMGDTRTLGELGVVDPAQVNVSLDDLLAGKGFQGAMPAWEILNLEAWARAHYRPGE